ncbi:hypothetical protein [Pseudovibrio sp. POLY-S9]|uniref:hypothetical protein n=1 Tax=Pseudovibrio sp. POLY-S9 TaxID=1576596 RepID=UPI00070AC19F|nr:hypothetical protein [Pseudovibrio sp. POLY-S9]
MEQIKLNEEAWEAARKAAYPHTTPDFKAWGGEVMVELEREELIDPIEAYLSHPSALRSIIEQSVKPLEWNDNAAQAASGTEYQIYRYDKSWACASMEPEEQEWAHLAFTGSETEAKDACQDYETEQVLKLFNLGGKGDD